MKKTLLVALIIISAFAVSGRKDPDADTSERIDMLFWNCVFAVDEDEYYKSAEELDLLQISTTEETLSKYKARVLLASDDKSVPFANDFFIKSYVRRKAFSKMSLDAVVDNAFDAAFSDSFVGSARNKGEGDRSAACSHVTSETRETLSRILGGCRPRSAAVGSDDGTWLFSSECAVNTDRDGGLVSVIACFDGWNFDECARNLKKRMIGRSDEGIEESAVNEQEGTFSSVGFSVTAPSLDCTSFQVTLLPGGLVFLECPI